MNAFELDRANRHTLLLLGSYLLWRCHEACVVEFEHKHSCCLLKRCLSSLSYESVNLFDFISQRLLEISTEAREKVVGKMFFAWLFTLRYYSSHIILWRFESTKITFARMYRESAHLTPTSNFQLEEACELPFALVSHMRSSTSSTHQTETESKLNILKALSTLTFLTAATRRNDEVFSLA